MSIHSSIKSYECAEDEFNQLPRQYCPGPDLFPPTHSDENRSNWIISLHFTVDPFQSSSSPIVRDSLDRKKKSKHTILPFGQHIQQPWWSSLRDRYTRFFFSSMNPFEKLEVYRPRSQLDVRQAVIVPQHPLLAPDPQSDWVWFGPQRFRLLSNVPKSSLSARRALNPEIGG